MALSRMPGHVFLIWGDLTKLACDAWLLPTDAGLGVSRSWRATIQGRPRAERIEGFGTSIQSFAFPDWHEPGMPKTPVPYFTNVVRGNNDRIIESAVEFVEVARHTEHLYPKRARRLLALPLVSTGYGGRRHRAGEIVEKLLPALERAVEDDEPDPVDVALVLYEESDFAAAQALRSARGNFPLPPGQKAVADGLAELARAGKLVLFLGAGVAMPAGGPSWKELISSLATGAGLHQELDALIELDPLDAARLVEKKLNAAGGGTLRDAVTRHIPNDRFSLTHALLAGLPSNEAVTTNYDDLFELACEGTYGRPKVLPREADAKASRWLLKMHGSLAQGDDIVLTRTDYIRYEARRAALAGIVQALLITRHMLFVGYSLRDDTFLRIVDAVRRAVHPEAPDAPRTSRLGTALTLEQDSLFSRLWEDDLSTLSFGAGDPRELSRQQDIFLDYLLMQSTPATAHLLDPSFHSLLSDDEKKLAKILEHFEQELASVESLARSPARVHIDRLFEALGKKR